MDAVLNKLDKLKQEVKDLDKKGSELSNRRLNNDSVSNSQDDEGNL